MSNKLWIPEYKPLPLSIIMPAIRPERWVKVYESILKSFSGEFELVIVSPYRLPEELEQYKNIKLVRDFGNPVRASNIAAVLCEKPMVTWTADDAVYLPGALDEMMKDYIYLEERDNEKVIVGKYFEGQDGTDKPLQDDWYFKVNGSTSTKLADIPDDYWLFNIALMRRSFMEKMGYWDTRFEACPMAHTDMAIRAQRNGARVKMCSVPILDCGHMPGTTGDHAPIHYAQLGHDEPLFRYLHGCDEIKLGDIPRPSLSQDGWKRVPAVWQRRFS